VREIFFAKPVNFKTGKRAIVNATVFSDDEILTGCTVGMAVTAKAMFSTENRSVWHGFPVKTPVPITSLELVLNILSGRILLTPGCHCSHTVLSALSRINE
jgi:hypothetical protein